MANDKLFIPFTAYIRVVPERTYNHRRTYTRSLEKISDFAIRDIREYLELNPGRFNINEQHHALGTLQFGQNTARITITGWDIPTGDTTSSPDPTVQPASQIVVDAPYTTAGDDGYDGEPGKVIKGYAGTQYLHPQGQTFDQDFIDLFIDFKATLEASSPIINGSILRIDYLGVTFGETGHSFP